MYANDKEAPGYQFLKELADTGKLPLPQGVVDYYMQEEHQEEISKEKEEAILADLLTLQRERSFRKRKLSNFAQLNNLGEYIYLARKELGLERHKFSKLAELDDRKLDELERNRISPLNIPARAMALIIHQLKLNYNWLDKLIKGSIALMNLSPNAGGAIARVSKDLSKPEQNKSILSARQELLLKTQEKSVITQDIADQITQYLGDVKNELGRI